MNLHGLDQTLRRLGLPTALVSLGREIDSAWCVVGTGENRWEVYWNHAGAKHSHTVLDSESTACYFLLGKLVHDQALAGEFELPG